MPAFRVINKVASKEEIRVKVSSNKKWAERAIIALYARQTYHEQEQQGTIYDNTVGFNFPDSRILSSFAEQIQKGYNLTDKQLTIAYKRLPKYAGQLEAIAMAKQSQI